MNELGSRFISNGIEVSVTKETMQLQRENLSDTHTWVDYDGEPKLVALESLSPV